MHNFKLDRVLVAGFAHQSWNKKVLIPFLVRLFAKVQFVDLKTVVQHLYFPSLVEPVPLEEAADAAKKAPPVFEHFQGLILNLDDDSVTAALVAGLGLAHPNVWIYGLSSDKRVDLDHIDPLVRYAIEMSGGAIFRSLDQLPTQLRSYSKHRPLSARRAQNQNTEVLIGCPFGFTQSETWLREAVADKIADMAAHGIRLTFQCDLAPGKALGAATFAAALHADIVVVPLKPSAPTAAALVGLAIGRGKRVIIFGHPGDAVREFVCGRQGVVVHNLFALMMAIGRIGFQLHPPPEKTDATPAPPEALTATPAPASPAPEPTTPPPPPSPGPPTSEAAPATPAPVSSPTVTGGKRNWGLPKFLGGQGLLTVSAVTSPVSNAPTPAPPATAKTSAEPVAKAKPAPAPLKEGTVPLPTLRQNLGAAWRRFRGSDQSDKPSVLGRNFVGAQKHGQRPHVRD